MPSHQSFLTSHVYFYKEAENYRKVEILCSAAPKRDQSPRDASYEHKAKDGALTKAISTDGAIMEDQFMDSHRVWVTLWPFQ